MSVRCFWLEPIGRARLSLRCHANGPCAAMPGEFGYHNAKVLLFEVDERRVPHDGPRDWVYEHDGPQRPEDVWITYEWPERCACGFVFGPEYRQVFSEHLYRRVDTGEVRPLNEWAKTPGAMWDAEWLADFPRFRGPDGRCLHAVCPNGREWCIDGPASNCTMPTDNVHKCWVRHGVPPDITVDKNGVTCAAGAGSIQAGDYHGFLRDGIFT